MPSRFRSGAAVLVAAVAVLMGCVSGTPRPPSPVSKPDLAGRWCGVPGEVLTLELAGGFSMEGASTTLIDVLLAKSGYIDGYRVKTEFGGVRPTAFAGAWKIWRRPSGAWLELDLDRISDRKVDEEYGMDIEYDEDGWWLAYPTDTHDPDESAPMRRCDVITNPTG